MLGHTFIGNTSYLNIIGRIAFPIFAFQISEGYKYTKNFKKYIFRLGLFAIISQIPFIIYRKSIGTTSLSLNVFFTLLMGLISIINYDIIKNKYNNVYLGLIPVIFFAILAQICKCDYGWYGITIIFLFHLLKENKLYMNLSVILAMCIKYLTGFVNTFNIYYIYFLIGAISSLIFISLYNNKKGKNIKYVLYVFYPLHLIILYLIKIYLL